jgi:membrane protein implicated in regulation of membrane protease activity
MTGGQVAALLFAILLLLPGGCFLVIGIGMLAEGSSSGAVEALSIGIPILAVMGLLFWFAFSRRQPPPGTGTTSA